MHEFTCGADGQVQRIPLRIASLSSIFVRFSLLRLFPVSEEMIRRKEIHYQRAAHRWNRGLFWRVGQIILFRRLEKIGESFGSSASNWKETILRNKNEFIKKKCVLLCFSKNLLTCPRISLHNTIFARFISCKKRKLLKYWFSNLYDKVYFYILYIYFIYFIYIYFIYKVIYDVKRY